MKIILLGILAALLLNACAGQAPQRRYYTLDLGPAQAQTQSPLGAATPILAVGPVTVPETVDRPELVVRSGPNRVALLENDRWAEPLKLQLARALAARLGQALPQAQVIFHRDNAAGSADWRLTLDVQRFESAPGQSVTLETIWTLQSLRQKGNAAAARSGRAILEEPVRGTGADAMVAAHDRALERLAATLASAYDAAAKTP